MSVIAKRIEGTDKYALFAKGVQVGTCSAKELPEKFEELVENAAGNGNNNDD